MTDLKALIAEINSKVGGDVLHVATDPRYSVDYLSTGLLPFDLVMGGGLPFGRMVEVYGAWSTLKSYIGLNAIRSAQQRGLEAALVDTEHAFDADWAQQCGVDTSKLIVAQPDDGEMAFDTMEMLIRADIGLLVVDSVAATLPAQEREKRLHGESVQPGRLAALMSTGLRKLTAANSKTAILWINQLREQIGMTFGNPEKPSGGRALAYYASARVNIQKTGKVTTDRKTYTGEKWETAKDQVGQRFKITVDKSKLDRPNRQVQFVWDLVTGTIDETGFLINTGIETGAITTAGAYYSVGGERVQGKEKLRSLVKTNPEVRQVLMDNLPVVYGRVLGPGATPRTKADVPSKSSSEREEHEPTQDQAAAASSSTAAPTRKSSKSRKLPAATR